MNTESWKETSHRIVCFTLDLEADFAGRLINSYQSWDEVRVTELIALLSEYKVPLTIFVVGQELLKDHPAVQMFSQIPEVEFQLHSHTHSLAHPDSEQEITLGKQAFLQYFGTPPQGYRAPEGRISIAGLHRLHAHGFSWDSSVFPSLLSHPQYYLRADAYDQTPVTELPVGVLAHGLFPASLSWAKLLGWRWFEAGLQQRDKAKYLHTTPIVGVFHLHDLWQLPAKKELPLAWQVLYSRNETKGIKYLKSWLAWHRDHSYTFKLLSHILPT